MRKRSLQPQLVLAPLVLAGAVSGQWPFQTGAPNQNFTSPAIADLNDDGVLEIVFGSWDGRLHCVTPSGTELWSLYLSDEPDTDERRPQLHASPTVADLDGDPSTLEIVVASGRGRVWGRIYVVSFRGRELARFDTSSDVMASPLVVDADVNGFPEIYIGAAFAPYPYYSIEIVHAAGTVDLVPRWSVNLPRGGVRCAAAAGDLTGDGRLEIVVPAGGIPSWDVGGRKIFAFRSDGRVLWSSRTSRFNNFASPVLADIDGTGRLDVLQASTDGSLYCLRGATGERKWTFRSRGQSLLHTPAVADLAGDSRPEIVFGSYDSAPGASDWFSCLDSSGDVLWERAFPGKSLAFSSPAVGDLDRNGAVEIVFGAGKSVVALDSSGNTAWALPLSGLVWSSPALADLNGDGTLETCFGVYNRTYDCLDHRGHRFQFAPRGPLLERAPWPSWHRTITNLRVQR